MECDLISKYSYRLYLLIFSQFGALNVTLIDQCFFFVVFAYLDFYFVRRNYQILADLVQHIITLFQETKRRGCFCFWLKPRDTKTCWPVPSMMLTCYSKNARTELTCNWHSRAAASSSYPIHCKNWREKSTIHTQCNMCTPLHPDRLILLNEFTTMTERRPLLDVSICRRMNEMEKKLTIITSNG